VTAALILVLAAAGYTLAQMGGPGGMMGHGYGMMGQSGMMGGAGWGMMSGQPLTPEQLEQFAAQHGITVEQARQMTDTCAQIMGGVQGERPQAR
jgi:hypothetical protein